SSAGTALRPTGLRGRPIQWEPPTRAAPTVVAILSSQPRRRAKRRTYAREFPPSLADAVGHHLYDHRRCRRILLSRWQGGGISRQRFTVSLQHLPAHDQDGD